MESLSGSVERITYHSSESGFAVLKVRVKKFRELVSVIGSISAISVGEDVAASGTWQRSVEHGLQFKANNIRSIPPTTIEGIEKYLGSGLVKGVGPHFAKKLVKEFGKEVLDVIERFPSRLATIRGIGEQRACNITKYWSEQKKVREIMLFLHSHGVGSARAAKIFRTYGDSAIEIVSQNPYRLIKDIRGIGFASADKIASNLGIAIDSEIRARAGLHFILSEALSVGHIGLPRDMLLQKVSEILSIPNVILESALAKELEEAILIADKLANQAFIFLAAYYFYEKNIASRLKQMAKEQPIWKRIDADGAISWVQEKIKIRLAQNQQEAIKSALKSKVCIITGGPGTGKTTILKALISILKVTQIKIRLCAPTGRAAKRLSEATYRVSYTIHRLLKYDPNLHKFQYDQNNPLDCDLLIADESSMIDVQLMHSLLKALPERTSLILVGDVDQLPSVGPGAVISDIIDSGVVKVEKLTKIFRQASRSDIIINSHRINRHIIPKLEGNTKDFHFFQAETEEVISKLTTLITKQIPRKFQLDSINDIQVLTPMQRGLCGARNLNFELQKALNPTAQTGGIEKFGNKYAVNDKVMQIVNNYNKEVYNGDIGKIQLINVSDQEMHVEFDGRLVPYDFSELDEITLSYAITVHKSQGAEYPAVVIPIVTQHFMMLQKNLLYTAVTRGKVLVVLVGQKKAVAIAVKNKKDQKRFTKLQEWMVV